MHLKLSGTGPWGSRSNSSQGAVFGWAFSARQGWHRFLAFERWMATLLALSVPHEPGTYDRNEQIRPTLYTVILGPPGSCKSRSDQPGSRNAAPAD